MSQYRSILIGMVLSLLMLAACSEGSSSGPSQDARIDVAKTDASSQIEASISDVSVNDLILMDIANLDMTPGDMTPGDIAKSDVTTLDIAISDLTLLDMKNSDAPVNMDQGQIDAAQQPDVAMKADQAALDLNQVDICNADMNEPDQSLPDSGQPRVFTASVALVAGNGTQGDNDATGENATFKYPAGLSLDSTGQKLYIADKTNNRIRVLDTTTKAVTTLAGSTSGYSDKDEIAEDAQFYLPYSVAVGGDVVYVADWYNYAIRLIKISDKMVTTVAGKMPTSKGSGFIDADLGKDARFKGPWGIVVDTVKNLIYVSDDKNHSIRMIDPTNNYKVTTIAGKGPTTAEYGLVDGALADSRFNTPVGLAIDSAGNIYVADSGNHCIRRINFTKNVVETLPGTDFNTPRGVTVDSDGVVYVSDTMNHAIRVIADGKVQILAGSTSSESGYVEGAGTDARFNTPHGLAVDNNQSPKKIYVADTNNHRIREITVTVTVE